jgi:hypothetical protein
MSSEVKANKLSPASGTDVTLGDASDTFTIPASATLDVNGTIDVTGATVTGLSAGKVLQVVNSFYTSASSTTNDKNDPFVATGLTATITPASTSNEILILITASMANSTSNPNHLNLMRDSTAISQGTTGTGSQQNNSFNHPSQQNSSPLTYSYSFLDSPSTTSATAYSLYWHVSAGTGYMNTAGDGTDASYVHRSPSSITLLEIEG